MKQYEYVRLDLSGPAAKEHDAHRGVIDEYAGKGFRFAGWVPVCMTPHGYLTKIDLIFERDGE